jgi:hypothetical protein
MSEQLTRLAVYVINTNPNTNQTIGNYNILFLEISLLNAAMNLLFEEKGELLTILNQEN